MSSAKALAAFRIAIGAIALFIGAIWWVAGVPLAFCAAWGVLSAFVLVGWRARLSCFGLVVTTIAMIVPGLYTFAYLFAILAFYVGLSDCERVWAVRPRGSGEVAAWPLFLIRCQLSIVYGFTGLAKINPDFLSGAVLAEGFSQSALSLPELSARGFVALAAGTVAAELGLAAAPWFRRTRVPALLAAAILHTSILLLSSSLVSAMWFAVIGALMVAMFIAFFAEPGAEPAQRRADRSTAQLLAPVRAAGEGAGLPAP